MKTLVNITLPKPSEYPFWFRVVVVVTLFIFLLAILFVILGVATAFMKIDREWFKDFAGPIATILAAIVAAGITWRFNSIHSALAESQRDIALDKLKFDLFDKRYKVFSATKRLIELTKKSGLDQVDPSVVRDLYIELDEARFFFGPDIQGMLREIHELAERIFAANDKRNHARRDDEAWNRLSDEILTTSTRLHGIYAALPSRFENELAFGQLTKTNA